MILFTSLAEAIHAGYYIVHRIPEGYLMKQHLFHGIQFARVVLTESA